VLILRELGEGGEDLLLGQLEGPRGGRAWFAEHQGTVLN